VQAYFDCFSGISGDMALGAFIDLGIAVDRLQQDLSRLPIGPFDIAISSVERHGIHARYCQVNDGGGDPLRHYRDIRDMIAASFLPDSVKAASQSIFRKIAEAEAHVHGCALDEVHFHEVGALDSIVDIVGCALCLHYLDITAITASALPQGHGFVDCQHGKLPLPAPATLALLKDTPVYGMAVEGELVTPTGAAILSALSDGFGPMPPMKITAVGYGAGRRVYDTHPNLLRVVIGEPLRSPTREAGYLSDTVCVLETTIDDMNPEIFGYLMEALFSNGALDVYWVPIYMKKNRPGTLIQVLCHAPQTDLLRDILFKETTTIGLRVSTAQRWMLPRETVTLELPSGPADLKRVSMPDGAVRWVPEYESCRRWAQERGIPIRQAYELITAEAAALQSESAEAPTR